MTNHTSFPKHEIRIVLLEGISASAEATFRAAGYNQIESYPHALAEDELMAAIKNVHILGIRSRTALNASVFAQASRLMAVGCFCIGTNQVDLKAAEHNGIPVFNAPYSNTRSVAELVIGQIINLFRGIGAKNAQCQRGQWSKTASNSREIRGKTLGIVGYGHIGAQVSVMAESLGMHVIYHDIETKLTLGNARPAETLNALLAVADAVTLHVPQTPATAQMISAKQLAMMKPGAYLINTARGHCVDLDALKQAIESGHLGGAAIDVFPSEPQSNKDRLMTPLIGLDQVILTPHIGGSTLEAQTNIGCEVASKLVRYSDNGSTLSAVNFPEVALPEHPGSVRLLHIHRNVPGVMSQLNALLSAHQINIDGQFLRTNPQLGYVVVDMSVTNKQQANALKEALAGLEHTLGSRILYDLSQRPDNKDSQ